MKTTFNVEFLRYVDRILGQCGKKANSLGIHNDSEKIVFFIPLEQLRLDFLNDIRIAVKSDVGDKFTIGIEYEIFRKLLSKEGLLEFDISDSYLSIKSDSGKHRFKTIPLEYDESSSNVDNLYELFTTDLAIPLSLVWEPEYNPKDAGNFTNDINVSLNHQVITVVTTNRNLITRSRREVSNKATIFNEEKFSIPGNALTFLLSTLKDINVIKLGIVNGKEIQVLLADSKFNSTLKYNIKLSATQFPAIDALLSYSPDSFTANDLKRFMTSFVTVKNQNLKEIVMLSINGNELKMSLVHNEHESEATLAVSSITGNEKVTLYLDFQLVTSVIKNIPENNLYVGMFETKIHIRTEDGNFSSVIMGINPEAITTTGGKDERREKADTDQGN